MPIAWPQTSSCSWCQTFITSTPGISGAGAAMGNVAEVFEAIARPCPQQGSDLWPSNVHHQRQRVMRTRRDFGLDWRYANNCSVGNHNQLPVTPDHSARLRHATVITIPDGASTTFQDKVFEFFDSDAASDLAFPTQSLCPYCADGVHETMCDWTLLQWTTQTAPDRIFFRASGVFGGLYGLPMSPSMTFTMGAAYSLVGVSYHLALGAGPRKHFVSQVRLRGRWHRYDCMQGGVVNSADAYDAAWHRSSVHMLVYLKSSMCVATPGVYEPPQANLAPPQQFPHHSPSGANAPRDGPANSGGRLPLLPDNATIAVC